MLVYIVQLRSLVVAHFYLLTPAIYYVLNKQQEPTGINVLQLRILTNNFKILKIQILMCYTYGI